MTVVVADTSALVSLGTVTDHDPDPLGLLLDSQEVVVPEQVISELEETASYEDASAEAAQAVLDRRSEIDVRSTALEEDFPLDDGENAAVTLANDLDATQLLCDEFNSLALVHASLADTRLVTTPTLLTAFVQLGEIGSEDAVEIFSAVSAVRSWETNSYVARARATLEQGFE